MATAVAVFAGMVTTTGVASIAVAPVAAAAAGATGTAGLFVATNGRVMDTRAAGLSPYAGSPMPAGTWRGVQVVGNAGIPTTGVSAVQLTFTVVAATAAGNLWANKGGVTSQTSTYLNYSAGQSISNAGILPVSADGKINVMASGATDLVIDVQGYFTSGDTTAAGGYVPLPTAVALSPNLSLPAAGSTASITVGGVSGIPADASAAMLNFVVVNGNSTSTYIVPYATGSTRPTDSLNVPSAQNTAVSSSVELGTAGKITVYLGTGGPVTVTVQVEGYYTAAGTGSSGSFTPASTRVYDSRSYTALAAGETRTVMIAGHNGIPLVGAGISALAVQLAVIPGTGANGHMQVYPDDGAVSAFLTDYYSGQIRSDFMVIRPGVDGGIKFQNSSGGPVNIAVDIEGWYSTVGTAIPAGQTRTQKRITLQANAAGGGPFVSYQYRAGTTAAFTTVPVADVTVPGTTTHPTGWPVGHNTGGTFDPYTWDLGPGHDRRRR